MQKPWWRKQNGHWYLDSHGKQIRLSTEPDPDGGGRKDPPVAVQNEWHRRMREGSPEDMQLGDLVQAYLAALPDGSDIVAAVALSKWSAGTKNTAPWEHAM